MVAPAALSHTVSHAAAPNRDYIDAPETVPAAMSGPMYSDPAAAGPVASKVEEEVAA